jgi:hypothetical protein
MFSLRGQIDHLHWPLASKQILQGWQVVTIIAIIFNHRIIAASAR